MTSNSPVCYANIPSGTSGRTHTERYSAVQPAGFGKIGMTIEEAADYTGIGRNTLRRLVAVSYTHLLHGLHPVYQT